MILALALIIATPIGGVSVYAATPSEIDTAEIMESVSDAVYSDDTISPMDNIDSNQDIMLMETNGCEIDGTQYDTLDEALAVVQTGETIKLFQDINYDNGIIINGKDITFDLNGHTLNVNNTQEYGIGLKVIEGGKVYLSGSGALNVKGTQYGVFVASNNGACEATVTNATATGPDGTGAYAHNKATLTVLGNAEATGVRSKGAHALDGGKITVKGNTTGTDYGVYASKGFGIINSEVAITAEGNAKATGFDLIGNATGTGVGAYNCEAIIHGNVISTRTGISVRANGSIVIDGTITAPEYIQLSDNDIRGINDFEEDTTKEGYRTYKNNNNIVWVKGIDSGDIALPIILTVLPEGNNVQTNIENLIITFNEPMDPFTIGTVTINPPITLSEGKWSNNNKTITYTLSGIAYSTTYNIGISGFKDIAGNTMNSDNGHSFITMGKPVIDAPVITGISVNPSELINSGGDITISITGENLLGHTIKVLVNNEEAATATVDNPSKATARINIPANTSSSNKSYKLTITLNGAPVEGEYANVMVNKKQSSNNSSGGGNGNSTSKSMDEPNGEAQMLDSNETVSKTIQALMDNSTRVVSVVCDSASLTNAFDASKADANGFKIIKIDIPEISGAKAYETVLPASFWTLGDGSKIIEIKTSITTVQVPENMFTTAEIAGAKNISLIITPIEKSNLNAAVQPLIELNVKIDGKQVPLNVNTPVTVAIPYKPTFDELEGPEYIVARQIDENGIVTPALNGRYDSTTGTITFNATHFGRYAVCYVHKTFADLDNVEWARKSIEVMASQGIINGTDANAFSPTTAINRADYLVLLTKTLGLGAEFEDNFDDVEPDTYYYQAVGIAKKLGITAGKGNNLFAPRENISRQDMMVLTINALKQLGKLNFQVETDILDQFSDKEDIAYYAVESLAALVKEGFIAGSENKLHPQTQTTRAEAAVFLHRIYNGY
jgi:hypothetical protein